MSDDNTKDNDQLIDQNLDNIQKDDEEIQDDNEEDILKKDFIEAEAPKYGPYPWLDAILGNKFEKDGGYKFDRSTVRFLGPAMILYIILFFVSGLYKIDCVPMKVLFVIGIGLWIFLILNRRTQKVQHVTAEAQYMFNAAERSIVLLSVFTLFTVLTRINHDTTNTILLASIMISTIAGGIWYTYEDKPLNYRNNRNIGVAGINLSLMLFVLLLAKNYYCTKDFKY
jgi:hypothetical protein